MVFIVMSLKVILLLLIKNVNSLVMVNLFHMEMQVSHM